MHICTICNWVILCFHSVIHIQDQKTRPDQNNDWLWLQRVILRATTFQHAWSMGNTVGSCGFQHLGMWERILGFEICFQFIHHVSTATFKWNYTCNLISLPQAYTSFIISHRERFFTLGNGNDTVHSQHFPDSKEYRIKHKQRVIGIQQATTYCITVIIYSDICYIPRSWNMYHQKWSLEPCLSKWHRLKMLFC